MIKMNIFSAARNGQEDIVRQLLDRGVDVNMTRYDETILMVAAREGHENVVRLLLERGADVNAAADTSLTAASREGHENVVRLLLDRGANVNAINNVGETALMAASQWNYENINVVRLLLERGADVNAINDDGETALILASSEGDGEVAENIVRFLLERGADVNIRTNIGETALIIASRRNYEQMIRLLLDRGADINAVDNNGDTSLIWASKLASEDAVRLLLDRGADVNMANNNGETALDIAQEEGYHNIVRLLQPGLFPVPVIPRWTELCDDLSEAGIEELRDILRNDVTAENYTTVAEAFELTSTEPTEDNISRFKNSLEQYTKPQLCARLAQYYYQCRDKIDAISRENWFEDYSSYGPVVVTADRNCYSVENLYQTTLRNNEDPLTRKRLSHNELRSLRLRREFIRHT